MGIPSVVPESSPRDCAGGPRRERQTGGGHYIYRVDAFDRITYVNNEWLVFAWENDAPSLARAVVIGRSLWSYVSGWQVRALYEAVFERLRSGTLAAATIPFRCDGPSVRRDMQLEIRALHDRRLELRGVLLEARPTVPVELLSASAPRGERTLVMCSWCKRVSTPQGWVEAEVALGALDVRDAERLPCLQHGVCATCVQTFRDVLH